MQEIWLMHYVEREIYKCCLWKYINGTAVYSVDKDAERYELHDKESDFAFSLIVLCIDNGQYIHVQCTKYTKDVWDVLSQHYHKISLYQ